MVSEWKIVKFCDLVTFVSEKGKAADANFTNYISTENMLVDFGGITKAANLPNNGSVTRFQTGDILFSNIRTYFRKVWQAKFDGFCSNDVLVFRSKDTNQLLPSYLYQICRWERFTEFSIRTSKGAKMPRGDKDALAGFHVPLPSISEQCVIADILCKLDDYIELAHRMNETLEVMAQTLFKSWFVDFDPVRAKQEGRVPEGMDAETAALFPDSFEESELGLIPKGWRVKKVEDALELVYGKALKSTDRISGKFPVYGSGGVTGSHNQALVQHPSIIVGRKGTIGSLYWEDGPFFPIDTVFYVKPKIPLTYCYYLLETLGLDGLNTDGAVPGLNRNNAYRLQIVFGSDDVINVFDDFVNILRLKIYNNNKELHTLSNLRDSLLPRLISGQLRIPDDV